MISSFPKMRLAALSLLILPGVAISQEVQWSERTTAIGAVKEIPSGTLSKEALDHLMQIGEDLFVAKFTSVDGLGRPAATQASSRSPALRQ